MARGSDVMLHGFFVDDVLRGVADLRILGRETEAALSIVRGMEPWNQARALLLPRGKPTHGAPRPQIRR